MTMRKKWIIVLAVLIAAGAATFFILKNRSGRKGSDLLTQVVRATEGSIEDTVEATGEVQPLNRVEIKPPIAGRIENLRVDEGNTVKSGQILGWMSSTDRAAILDAARAKGEDELKH